MIRGRQEGCTGPRFGVPLLAFVLALVALVAIPLQTRAEVGTQELDVAQPAVWPANLDTSGSNLGVEGDVGFQVAAAEAEHSQSSPPSTVASLAVRSLRLQGQLVAAGSIHTPPILTERNPLRMAPKTSPPAVLR